MLYQHTKFQQNPSIGFGVMLRTKNAEGRTEGRRDNEAQTYSPPTGWVVGLINKMSAETSSLFMW